MPILIALLVLIVMVGGPLAVIWALNTLFSLNIPFTFWTWLAVVILAALIPSSTSVSKS